MSVLDQLEQRFLDNHKECQSHNCRTGCPCSFCEARILHDVLDKLTPFIESAEKFCKLSNGENLDILQAALEAAKSV